MSEAPGEQQSYPNPAYAWYALGIVCFAYVFAFIDRILVGLLTPAIQADLGLTDSEAGIIQGLAFALFYTLFGIPLGLLADRINRKWLLAAGATIWSLMTAACGLSRGFWQLFGARVGVGVGEATLNPCAASLIGDYFKPETRPKAFGVFTMSTAFGTGLTYLTGGYVIYLVTQYESISLPLLGELRPWQAAFMIIGLAGLIPAVLMAFTVREPARRDLAKGAKAGASLADTLAFLKKNKLTLFCHNLGVALVIMAVYGWVNWMPTFFVRIHDWSPAKFSFYYGIFGGLCGIISALSSGFVTAWFKKRGYVDGTMRTVLWGSVGLTLGAGVAPLMPTPELALGLFALTGIFSNWPTAQALMALNEMTPNQLRGLLTSIYIFVVGLLSAGFGPFAMGWVTDNVFADKQAVHYSMALVTLVTGALGSVLITFGLKSYRASLSRVDWT
jgi:MFS family permease